MLTRDGHVERVDLAREVMLVDGEMTYSWEQEGRNHRGHVVAPVAKE